MTEKEAMRLARETAKALGKDWKPITVCKWGIPPKDFYVYAMRALDNGENVKVFYYPPASPPYKIPARYQAQCSKLHGFAFDSTKVYDSPLEAMDALVVAIRLERDRLHNLLGDLLR